MCEVCGYRFGLGYMWTWLALLSRGQPLHKARRWPHRRAMAIECPECRWRVLAAQEISGRGSPVVEFL